MKEKESKHIIITDFKGQEQANYDHWNCLSPEKRLAEHYILITHFYKEAIERNRKTKFNRIIFD